MLWAPDLRHPSKAVLRDPRGLVEIHADEGTWMVASPGSVVEAGQQVRTGELSSVRLAFYDGSQASLGPNTEVAVEQLDAHRSDGPRIVLLRQLTGVTNHDVAPTTDVNSRYEVHTATAAGSARGTEFFVRVTPDGLTQFGVDEGVVSVSSENVTVDVVAGQATTVRSGEPPGEPTFRITGEGEVTQSAPTWIIAGHTFLAHEESVIVGNPQVGDWVFVEGRLLPDGRRVADRIVLLRRSAANQFSIVGRVGAKGEAEWTVAEQTILIDDETDVYGDIDIGNLVRVQGIILESGALLAKEIWLLEDTPGTSFKFTGAVQAVTDETWLISGILITVNEETDLYEDPEPGDIVAVCGWILEDGRWLAASIERVGDAERGFDFAGEVDSIVGNTWVVAGITIETRDWTEIDSEAGVGRLVRVKGHILADGTWVASEIELLKDDKGLTIVYVGAVDEKAPSKWVVGGIPLQVNDETIITGDIEIDDLVKVTVRIQTDGTWLALKIELLDVDNGGLGCVFITAVVVDVGPGWIALPDWPRVDLEGVIIEGEIQVGSVILMQVCVDEDDAIHIVRIIVIYQPEPEIPPPPPPPPPDDDGGEKVTICHKAGSKNAHTITISKSALQAHLNHGDTLGPCKE
jgi:hypothetical protein